MLLGKSSYLQQIFVADKVQARMVLAGLYLLLLLPLAMIFSRTLAEVCGGLLGILFLVHSYRIKQWGWLKETPIIFALLLWLYSVLVVTPFAIDPQASLSRIDWFRFILLFAAIVYWLSDYHQELRLIAKIIIAVMFLSGLDAIYQFNTGFSLAGTPYLEERLTGPFHKVIIGIYFAKLGIPFLGILFYYALRDKKKNELAILVAMMAYIFAIIILSNERTAALSFSVSLLLIATGMFISFKKWRPYIFVMLAAIAIFLALAYQTQPALQNRLHITHAMLQDFSQSPYAQLWKASLLMWQEHPVTGVGMLNFRVACPALEQRGLVTFCGPHSHNVYLEVLSEFGTLGFTALLLLITSLIVAVIEKHSAYPPERVILTFFALGGLLINFFPLAPTQSFFSNWPALLAWQSIAWSLALMRGGKDTAHG